VQNGIVVVGSINMDMVIQVDRLPVAGETVSGDKIKYIPGGKGANQAVAAARLGARVAFIGRIGTDHFGDQLQTYLSAEKLDLRGLSKTDTSSGLAVVFVDKNGQNSIVILPGSNAQVTEEYLAAKSDIVMGANVVVSQYEIPMPTIEKLFSMAKQAGKITVLNPAPAKITSPSLFSAVDYLIVNQTELSFLLGVGKELEDIDEIIEYGKKLRLQGQNTVIVTIGEKGAIAIDKEEIVSTDSIKVNVVDTTAAGDCFVGAFATQIDKGASLKKALNFANRAAALSVQKLGASSSLPTLAEVEAMQL
jgi:ribokinase